VNSPNKGNSGPIIPLSSDIISEKRKLFAEIFNKLSSKMPTEAKDTELDELLDDFESLYSNGYRQMYSEIYPVISKMSDQDRETAGFVLGSLKDYLARDEVYQKYGPELFGKILKLTDHVNLEIQRIRKQGEIDSSLEEYQDELIDIQKRVKTAKRKISRMQAEFVMMIGIFTAIVMTFSGGITLLGSAFNQISAVDIYKLSLTTVITGTILGNVVLGLLAYVNKIVFTAEDEELNEGHLRKFSIIIVFNILMAAMLVGIITFWFLSGNPID